VTSRDDVRPWIPPAPPLAAPAQPLVRRLRRSSASILRRLDDLDESADPRVRGRRQLLVITFTRSGRRVPTPVWAASDGELLYFCTRQDSGKVKRLRADNSVLVAPCTPRGRPLHAPVPARARLLPPSESAAAEELLAAECGGLRAWTMRWQGLRRAELAYLALDLA
jgi:uncharacterized protein